MSEELRKTIEQANRKYSEAVRNQDPAALANLHTEDACVLPPNREMVRGRQAIQEFCNAMMQRGMKDIILTTVELLGGADMAQELGTYKIKIQPEGQETIKDKGKYIQIFKKTAEGWKTHWDIFNTDLPLEG